MVQTNFYYLCDKQCAFVQSSPVFSCLPTLPHHSCSTHKAMVDDGEQARMVVHQENAWHLNSTWPPLLKLIVVRLSRVQND